MRSKSAAEKASHQISRELIFFNLDLAGKLTSMTEVVEKGSTRDHIQTQNQDRPQALCPNERNRKKFKYL